MATLHPISERPLPPPYSEHQADILIRSSDGAVFRAHRTVLWQAAPVFALTLPPHISHTTTTLDVGANADAPPTVVLGEPARILSPLIQLCYPVTEPVLEDLSAITSVLDGALKYGMARAERFCLQTLVGRPMLDRFPFGVYAVAYRFKLEEETRLAAKNTLRFDLQWSDPMPREFASISATAVYELWRYRASCKSAALCAIRDPSWWDALSEVQYFPCFACDPEAESEAHVRYYSVDVEDCLRLTHELVSTNPPCADNLGDKILATTMTILACDERLLGPCTTRGCRQPVVDALRDVHRQVMDEIDRAISSVTLKIVF